MDIKDVLNPRSGGPLPAYIAATEERRRRQRIRDRAVRYDSDVADGVEVKNPLKSSRPREASPDSPPYIKETLRSLEVAARRKEKTRIQRRGPQEKVVAKRGPRSASSATLQSQEEAVRNTHGAPLIQPSERKTRSHRRSVKKSSRKTPAVRLAHSVDYSIPSAMKDPGSTLGKRRYYEMDRDLEYTSERHTDKKARSTRYTRATLGKRRHHEMDDAPEYALERDVAKKARLNQELDPNTIAAGHPMLTIQEFDGLDHEHAVRHRDWAFSEWDENAWDEDEDTAVMIPWRLSSDSYRLTEEEMRVFELVYSKIKVKPLNKTAVCERWREEVKEEPFLREPEFITARRVRDHEKRVHRAETFRRLDLAVGYLGTYDHPIPVASGSEVDTDMNDPVDWNARHWEIYNKLVENVDRERELRHTLRDPQRWGVQHNGNDPMETIDYYFGAYEPGRHHDPYDEEIMPLPWQFAKPHYNEHTGGDDETLEPRTPQVNDNRYEERYTREDIEQMRQTRQRYRRSATPISRQSLAPMTPHRRVRNVHYKEQDLQETPQQRRQTDWRAPRSVTPFQHPTPTPFEHRTQGHIEVITRPQRYQSPLQRAGAFLDDDMEYRGPRYY